METIVLKPDIQDVLSKLANQLHKSQNEVVQEAIKEYARKSMHKQKIMSFAGLLEDDQADDLIHVIRNNRIDKDMVSSL